MDLIAAVSQIRYDSPRSFIPSFFRRFGPSPCIYGLSKEYGSQLQCVDCGLPSAILLPSRFSFLEGPFLPSFLSFSSSALSVASAVLGLFLITNLAALLQAPSSAAAAAEDCGAVRGVRPPSLSRPLILNSPDFTLAASPALGPSLTSGPDRPRSVHSLTNSPFLRPLFRGINHFSAAQRLSYYSYPSRGGRYSVGRSRPLGQSLARKRHGLEKMGGRDETTESVRETSPESNGRLSEGIPPF